MTVKKEIYDNVGVLRISRRQGRARLVGSASAAQTFVTLTLTQGEVVSDEFTKEKIYPKESELIAEVSMTPMQWGELLSSSNIASGIPCTIEYKDGKRVEQTYETEPLADYYEKHTVDTFEKFRQEYTETMSKATDILENKKSIAKKDRETILSSYAQLSRLMEDTLPFVQRRMIEDTEEHIARSAAQFKSNMQELSRTQSQRTKLDQG